MNRRDLLKRLGLGAGAAALAATPKIVEAVAPTTRVTITEPLVMELDRGVPVKLHVLHSDGQQRTSAESYDIVTHEEVLTRRKGNVYGTVRTTDWESRIAQDFHDNDRLRPGAFVTE